MTETEAKGVSELLQEAVALKEKYNSIIQSEATDKDKLQIANDTIKALSRLALKQYEYLAEINRITDEAYISSLKPTTKQ